MNDLREAWLRVAIPLVEVLDDFMEGKYPEPQPYFGIVTQALVSIATPEDLALAKSCVDAEHDLREREFGALETLLGAIPSGGNLDHIFELPVDQQLAALRAAVACRWLRPAPEA